MTLTVNGLSPACLSTPTQLDLLTVAATMVWADNHRMRDAVLALERVKFYGCNVIISSDQVHDVVSRMNDDTPLNELATPGYHTGMQAGVYLHHAVATVSRGEPLLMKALAASLASWVGPVAAKTRNEFDNRVWPAYRPVAYLWAAHIHMHRGVLAKVIPCELTALPQFLGLAEGFLRLAEQTQTRGSGAKGRPRTLLTPGESVVFEPSPRIPETIPNFDDWINLSPENYSYEHQE
jgi:hypothetical protein